MKNEKPKQQQNKKKTPLNMWYCPRKDADVQPVYGDITATELTKLMRNNDCVDYNSICKSHIHTYILNHLYLYIISHYRIYNLLSIILSLCVNVYNMSVTILRIILCVYVGKI